jgi:hypothetical protein
MWAFARTIPFRSTCGHVSHCVRWPGIWSLSTERELIPAKWPPGDRLHCSCHNRSDRSPALPPACVRATAARHRSVHPHTLSRLARAYERASTLAGTPPQSFRAIVDSGSANFAVAGTAVSVSGHSYDPSASSTAKVTDRSVRRTPPECPHRVFLPALFQQPFCTP